MIKQERVNHRRALARVNGNVNKLKNMEQKLASIYEVIFSRPDFTFLNIVNQSSFDEVTYKEADKYNHLYAQYFSTSINKEEKYVGLMLDNCKEWIYCFFGLLLSGYTPVLLSTSISESELNHVITTLKLKTILTNTKLVQITTLNPYEIQLPNEVKELNREFAEEIIFLTSGSTGTPKIVFYSGKEICNQIYQTQFVLQNNRGIDKVYKGYFKHLVVLPFYHIFGLITVLLWFSFLNVTFVLPLSLNPKHLKQAALLTHPTHIFAVPLLYETIHQTIINKCDTDKKKKKLNKALKTSFFLQKCFKSAGLAIVRNLMFKKYLNMIFSNSIRYCISGGAFINPETVRMMNLIGYPLVNGYGSTEIGITSLNQGKDISSFFSTSIGEPFSSISYKVVDDYLYVKSPSCCSSYIDKNGERIVVSHEDWINTFDKVKVEDGQYYLLGRDDEVVVLPNGENISLSLKEKEINLPKAQDHVLLINNGKIILIASYNELVPISLVKNELSQIDNQKGIISSIYYTTSKLPKANSLKHKRYQILELFNKDKELFIHLDTLVKNEEKLTSKHEDELLNKVISAFSSIFPNEKINANSHFYNDLGGDSLRYFMLLNKMEEVFDITINIEDYNKAPYTPEEFMDIIRGQ